MQKKNKQPLKKFETFTEFYKITIKLLGFNHRFSWYDPKILESHTKKISHAFNLPWKINHDNNYHEKIKII